MPITATLLAQVYLPVTPAAAVRPVASKVDQDRSPAREDAKSAPVPSVDDLRRARADALAELQNAPDTEESNTPRYLGLDRDQLASIVFDRNQAYSVGERRSAQRQLDGNDRVYLDRAAELSRISGDDRVLLNAKLELERSKSPIERAVPRSEAVDTAALHEKIAAKTLELGGSPSSISLRYPSGWAAAHNDMPMPDSPGISNVSPGAARLALLYRESLF